MESSQPRGSSEVLGNLALRSFADQHQALRLDPVEPGVFASVQRVGGDVPGAGQQNQEQRDECRAHVHHEIEYLSLLIRRNSSHIASIASGRCPAPSGSLYQLGMKPPLGRPSRSTMLRQ